MQVEIYYGYYEGDAQMWDTLLIDIPKKMRGKSRDDIEA